MQVLGPVAALASFGALLAAGIFHLKSPGRMRKELAQQALWPRPVVPVVLFAVVAAEIVIGAGGLVALFGETRSLTAAIAQFSAVIAYLSLTAYGLALLRWRPGAPCGCGSASQPVSGWTVARSATLGVLALVALRAGSITVPSESPYRLSVLLLAATTFTILIWQLPRAMGQLRVEGS